MTHCKFCHAAQSHTDAYPTDAGVYVMYTCGTVYDSTDSVPELEWQQTSCCRQEQERRAKEES